MTIQCNEVTKKGTRCTRDAQSGEDYCWQHLLKHKIKSLEQNAIQLPDNPDWQIGHWMKKLANALLDKRPELWDIRDEVGIENIGFVRSYVKPKKGKKIKLAECRKVTGPMKAFVPYAWIITFNDYSISVLSDNQQKIVMLHELKHIGVDDKLVEHNIQDFRSILEEFGIGWTDEGRDVPDILKEVGDIK